MALTVATGAICVVGGLKYSEPLVLAQSVDDNAAATDLMLFKPIQNISVPKNYGDNYGDVVDGAR